MWANYNYLANTPPADLVSDICAILTGTTDPALLSASCDKALTTIDDTYAPGGWEMFDDAASATSKVVRAPCAGDATQYKYMQIDVNATGNIFTALWESWNATTHVGTNRSYQSNMANYNQKYATAASGALYISASARRALFYGVSSVGSGVNASGGGCSGIVEIDRTWGGVGVGQGIPPVAFMYPTNFTMCRYRDKNGAIQTTSTQTSVAFSMFGSASTSDNNPGNGYPTDTGYSVPVWPISGFNQSSASAPIISSITPAEVYFIPFGAALDETSYGGKTFIAIPNASGASKYIVPKG